MVPGGPSPPRLLLLLPEQQPQFFGQKPRCGGIAACRQAAARRRIREGHRLRRQIERTGLRDGNRRVFGQCREVSARGDIEAFRKRQAGGRGYPLGRKPLLRNAAPRPRQKQRRLVRTGDGSGIAALADDHRAEAVLDHHPVRRTVAGERHLQPIGGSVAEGNGGVSWMDACRRGGDDQLIRPHPAAAEQLEAAIRSFQYELLTGVHDQLATPVDSDALTVGKGDDGIATGRLDKITIEEHASGDGCRRAAGAANDGHRSAGLVDRAGCRHPRPRCRKDVAGSWRHRVTPGWLCRSIPQLVGKHDELRLTAEQPPEA